MFTKLKMKVLVSFWVLGSILSMQGLTTGFAGVLRQMLIAGVFTVNKNPYFYSCYLFILTVYTTKLNSRFVVYSHRKNDRDIYHY